MTDLTPQPPANDPPEDDVNISIPPLLDWSDRLTLLALPTVLILIAALFYFYIGHQGMLKYEQPGPMPDDPQSVIDDYFATALDYRERRLVLALTYRTFITTLGFTVGLVICAIGGIFVLRRATANLMITTKGPDGTSPKTHGLGWTLATTSPGIAFMIAGSVIMFFTQYLALPVGAPEIYPSLANAVCPSNQVETGACKIGQTTGPGGTVAPAPNPLSLFCESAPDDPDCAGYTSLLNRLELTE